MNGDACRSCGGTLIHRVDFGAQPLCNGYLTTPTENEFRASLRMAQCRSCSLVQLIDLVPPTNLQPREPLQYNEPEGHLDHLANGLPEPPLPVQRICGITYKDESLVKRLANRWASSWAIVCPEKDLGITSPSAGIETLQSHLTARGLNDFITRCGPPDLIVARHILEHVPYPQELLRRASAALAPQGRLLLEVPDCSSAFEFLDYSAAWEEHAFYFTPTTFQRTVIRSGWTIEHYGVYPYTLEDCLVIVASHRETEVERLSEVWEQDEQKWQSFVAGFQATRQLWSDRLTEYRSKYGQVAMFGAGHLAITFLNILGVGDLVSFVVDDSPMKIGKFMPGSKLPIQPSKTLAERGVKICLLAVAPESEPRVLERNGQFLTQGGRFISIFPRSPLAVETRL